MHTFVPPYSVEIVKFERKRKTNGPITYLHISHLHGLIHIWPECCMFARLISSHRILIRSFGRSVVRSFVVQLIHSPLYRRCRFIIFFFFALFFIHTFSSSPYSLFAHFILFPCKIFLFSWIHSLTRMNVKRTRMCGWVYRRMHFSIVCSLKKCVDDCCYRKRARETESGG